VRYNRLFFAQREAIETTIWLNEVANKSNAGTDILNQLKLSQTISENESSLNLHRFAFKIATGTGKTVVMALQILYHYFNRLEYKNDIRFADYFLIITPGITIKERLGVLFIDTQTKNKNEIQDYYHLRDLVPRSLEDQIVNLNSKLIITNFHTFEPKTLQGNKRSPFDGKYGSDKNASKENINKVISRALSKFRKDTRLLII
jgi:type III restriction enzyme